MGVLLYLTVSNYWVSAQDDEPLRLTGEDVIEYDHPGDVAIQDAVRRINRGERVGDACKFTTRLERAFGEPAKISRTLAVDSAKCEQLLEEGTVTPEDLKKITEGDATESSPAQELNPGGTDLKTGRSSGLLSSPLQSHINTAYFRTIWEDPINIDVNWVESMVKWWNDTTNEVVVYDSRSSCSWDWLALSGWTDEGGTCTWEYVANQSQVTVTKVHDFDNTSFPCIAGFGVATNYDPNVVGGTLVSSWGTSTTMASGDCAFLLDSKNVLY